MPTRSFRATVVAGLLLATTTTPHAQPAAARTYCTRPGSAEMTGVPPELMPIVGKSLGAEDPASLREAVYVRCVGPKLMGCFVGANLECGKADTRRTLEGATQFCKDNPNADLVPYAATGHGTIYEWSCKGRRAVAGKATVQVDAQGYIAENWHEIR